MTDYLLGIYHSSFDKVVTRSEVIEPERTSLSTLLDVEYRQAIKAIFGRVRLSAIRTIDNKIVSRTLEGTAQMSAQIAGRQTRDYLGGELYFSKQFQSIRSMLSLGTDYAYTSYPMIIGGQLNRLSSQTFGAQLELRSTPLKWLDLSAAISRREDLSQSSFDTFHHGEWLISGEVVTSFGEHWAAGLVGTYTNVGEVGSSNSQVYTILASNFSYRHPRFRVVLRINNLLDADAIYQFAATDADRIDSYFALRPRQITLSGYFKF